MDGVADALASAGFVTFDVAYRLAAPGRPGFPDQLGDLQQALAYLRDNASALHADPGRVGVLGSSAGDNLALLLATRAEELCGSQAGLSAAVTWSAPVDLARYGRLNQSHCDLGMAHCPLLYRAEEEYVGCAYQACPARWEAASVSPYVRAGDPPTLLFNSSEELVPLWQPRELAGLLTSRGVPNRLVVFTGHLHGIAYAPRLSLRPSRSFVSTWLQMWLRKSDRSEGSPRDELRGARTSKHPDPKSHQDVAQRGHIGA